MEGEHLLDDKRIRLGLLAVGLFALSVWWELFHEVSREWVQAASVQSGVSWWDYLCMKLHCPMRCAGVCLGSGLSLLLSRYGLLRPPIGHPALWLAGLLCLAEALNWVAFQWMHAYDLAVVVHLLASAALTYAAIAWAGCLCDEGPGKVFCAVLSFGLGLAVVNAIVMPLLPRAGFSVAAQGVRAVFLALSLVLLLPLANKEGREEQTFQESRIAEAGGRVRLLIMHLIMYGAVLEFLHVVGRRLIYGALHGTPELAQVATSGSVSLGLGAFLAAVVFVVFWKRRDYRFSTLWGLVRKVVFTLAMLEFLVLPLISFALPAVVLGDCASTLYRMLFVVGCYLVYKKSDCSASGLFAWGMLLLGLGELSCGLVLEATVRAIVTDSALFAFLRVAVFLLCTLATFWVGSDEEVKRLWGLRHKYLPKEYREAAVRDKCEILADRASLTGREKEIVALVAQGLRTDQIAAALYISPNTVRTHIQNAYGKLDIHSVRELSALLEEMPSDV